jgi:hypothetical protein
MVQRREGSLVLDCAWDSKPVVRLDPGFYMILMQNILYWNLHRIL